MNNRPGGVMTRLGSLRMSELLPMKNRGSEIASKGYVGPVVVSLLCFVLLAVVWKSADYYRAVLGAYACVAMTYVIYRLCGKPKSALVLGGAAAATFGLLQWSPALDIIQALIRPLSGPIPSPDALKQIDFIQRLWVSVVGIGLSEELLKALPVFAVLFLGRSLLDGVQRDRYGIWEPLDGIVVATASAAGFAFLETVFQYARNQQTPVEALQLEVIRLISLITGHIAYSGYFGYFIGLSVLRPKHKWTLLGIGWLSAAVLHGLWDASNNLIAFFIIGGLSYVALIAAILKARQLSPTRADNFATQLVGGGTAAKVRQAHTTPGVSTTPRAHRNGLALRIGNKTVPLSSGARLAEDQLAGLTSQAGDNLVAMVDRKPSDPSVLGLKNLSTSTWTVTLPSGERRELPNGKSIRLDRGTEIDFGIVLGRIE